MGKTSSWDVPQVTRLAKSEAYWPSDIPKVIQKAFTKAYPVPWETRNKILPGWWFVMPFIKHGKLENHPIL
jgi:hypothetical protein